MAITYGISADDLVREIAARAQVTLQEKIKAAIQEIADEIVADATKEIAAELRVAAEALRDPMFGGIAIQVVVDRRPKT